MTAARNTDDGAFDGVIDGVIDTVIDGVDDSYSHGDSHDVHRARCAGCADCDRCEVCAVGGPPPEIDDDDLADPESARVAPVYGFLEQLGRAARTDAPEVAEVDSDPIVDAAAQLAVGQDAADVFAIDPVAAAQQCGSAVARVQARTVPQFPPVGAVSWAGFGAVLPVLSGSPGAGASSVAAAITDLAAQQRCTLLVDADDPARSGLVCAVDEVGPWTRTVDTAGRVRVRYSWRVAVPARPVLVARAETSEVVFTPGMCPAPPDWLPDPAPDPLHLTVVDLGYGWRAAASPLYGPGAWLRAGTPAQRPVLVVRPSRPSLRQAEQVLDRLQSWVNAGAATPIFQLVVNGARKWPPGIAGTAGPRIRALLDTAVFVPHDPGVAVDGVTCDPSPTRVLAALRPLLASWGVLS